MIQLPWRRFLATRSLVNALTGASLLLLACLALLLVASLRGGLTIQGSSLQQGLSRPLAFGNWQVTLYPWALFAALSLAGTTLLGSVAVCRAGSEHRTQERLGRAGQALEIVLAEKEALLAEIHHRVKNNMQVVVNLLHLETLRLADHGARQRFDALGQRIALIGRVHERVYASENFACMDVAVQIREQCEELKAARPDLELALKLESLVCGLDLALPLALIVHELVNDALSHGSAAGPVEVALKRDGDSAVLSVWGVHNGPAELGPAGSGLTLVGVLADQIGASLDLTASDAYCVRLAVPLP